MENIKTLTYLSFSIKEEMFAIPVTNVLEVLQKQKTTRVPNAPDHVEGVINFRGQIIPLLDTRSKFGLPLREENEKHVVIVLQIINEDKTRIIGAMADKVKDVITIDENKIEAVPQLSASFNSEFLTGITRIDSNFTMLLDTNKTFAENSVSPKDYL